MKVWIKTLLKANTRVNKPMVTKKTECNYLLQVRAARAKARAARTIFYF